METMLEGRGGHRSSKEKNIAVRELFEKNSTEEEEEWRPLGMRSEVGTPFSVSEAESIVDTLLKSDKNIKRLKKRHESKMMRRRMADDEVNDMTSKRGVSTAGVGMKGRWHLSPLKTNDVHAESDILHRSGIVTGMVPGSARADLVKTPDDLSDQCSRMPNLQMNYLSDSDGMREVMRMLLTNHAEVEEICRLANVHRPQMSQRLDGANKFYLKLFERMLSEVLAMHRVKFKSQTAAMEVLQNAMKELQGLLDQEHMRVDGLRAEKDRLKNELNMMTMLCNAKDKELQLLQQEVDALEKYRSDYNNLIADEQRRLEEAERARLEARRKAEEETQRWIEEQMTELKRQWAREKALLDAAWEARVRIEPTAAPDPSKYYVKPDSDEASTQTAVDEYGVWDKQDGWLMPIKGTALARTRWRRAQNFAKCPSCRGQAMFMGSVAMMLKRLARSHLHGHATDHGGDAKQASSSSSSTTMADVSSKKAMKRREKYGKWGIPDVLVAFMSNVPRSIQATPVLKMEYVLRRIYSMLEIKRKNDEEDNLLGYPVQEAVESLIEAHLERSYMKSEAEQMLYLTVEGIRAHYTKHPLVQTFARFCGFLDAAPMASKEMTSGEVATTAATHSTPTTSVATIKTTSSETQIEGDAAVMEDAEAGEGADDASLDSVDRDHDALPNVGTDADLANKRPTARKKASKQGAKGKNKNKDDGYPTHPVTNTKLTLEMLSVYLFARQCMLAPYTGRDAAYAAEIKRARAGPVLVAHEDKIRGANGPMPASVTTRARALVELAEVKRQEQRQEAAAGVAAGTALTSSTEALPPDEEAATIAPGSSEQTKPKAEAGTGASKFKKLLGSGVGAMSAVNKFKKKLGSGGKKSALGLKAGASPAMGDAPSAAPDRAFGPVETPEERRTRLERETEDPGHPLPGWPLTLPRHICLSESLHFYLPLDRAVQVFAGVLHFLETKALMAVLRELEASDTKFLTEHGRLVEPEGNRTMIRAAMRRFQKTFVGAEDGEEGGIAAGGGGGGGGDSVSSAMAGTSEGDGEGRRRDWVVLVNLDRALQLMIEVVSKRGTYVEKRLQQLYVEGDDNGDGVLSFQEFTHIVTVAAPHFHHRRILKMYREALDIDGGDAIHELSFVHVCRMHGLVQLVDLEELKRGRLLALMPSAARSKEPAEAGPGAAAGVSSVKAKLRRMSTVAGFGAAAMKNALVKGVLGPPKDNKTAGGAEDAAAPTAALSLLDATATGAVSGGGQSPAPRVAIRRMSTLSLAHGSTSPAAPDFMEALRASRAAAAQKQAAAAAKEEEEAAAAAVSTSPEADRERQLVHAATLSNVHEWNNDDDDGDDDDDDDDDDDEMVNKLENAAELKGGVGASSSPGDAPVLSALQGQARDSAPSNASTAAATTVKLAMPSVGLASMLKGAGGARDVAHSEADSEPDEAEQAQAHTTYDSQRQHLVDMASIGIEALASPTAAQAPKRFNLQLASVRTRGGDIGGGSDSMMMGAGMGRAAPAHRGSVGGLELNRNVGPDSPIMFQF